MPTLPKKLKHDAIIEAVFEIRFDPGDALQEVVTGRLVDPVKWPGFTTTRLPFSNMPIQLMRAVPIPNLNIQYEPLFDLRREGTTTSVKISSQSIVCSMQRPYGGWDAFNTLHRLAIDNVFDAVKDVRIVRIGLRYINALSKEHHFVDTVSDLNVKMVAGERTLSDGFVLTYRYRANEKTDCLVRVATTDFTSPPYQGAEKLIVDTDTYTPDGLVLTSKAEVANWLSDARNVKNEAFFNLFFQAQIDKMKEA